ncbi:hypothetical protein OH492_24310 [Vibrio chagasii]|nr:hypothetical protein [Vibrio chagasii]
MLKDQLLNIKQEFLCAANTECWIKMMLQSSEATITMFKASGQTHSIKRSQKLQV